MLMTSCIMMRLLSEPSNEHRETNLHSTTGLLIVNQVVKLMLFHLLQGPFQDATLHSQQVENFFFLVKL